MEYKGKVIGTPPSKSNAYRIITINGHASLTKTKAMHTYEESFLWQVGSIRDSNINVPFEFYLDVYFPSKRSDLDGCFKGVEGKVARYHGQQRVAVVIDGLMTVATAYIPNAFLRFMDKE